MTRPTLFALAGLALLLAFARTVDGQSLRGSPASVNRQRQAALKNDYTLLETATDVRRFVKLGLLVPVTGDANYELGSVSYPYARPIVLTFIERLSAQYHSTCGERLVVTSLTRPDDEQPRNASALSVHPAGMAVDLRISSRTKCRQWLERTLLAMEKTGVIEATREKRPAHLHVAVYPDRYSDYASRAGASNE